MISEFFARVQAMWRCSPLLTPVFRAATMWGFMLLTLFAPSSRTQSPPQIVVAMGPQNFQASIFQLNPSTGALTELSASPAALPTNQAEAFTINPAGTFLFIAYNSNLGYTAVEVFAINQSTGALTQVPNSPFATGLGSDAVAMVTDHQGKYLYVGNQVVIADGQENTLQGEIDSYAIESDGELAATPGVSSITTAPITTPVINTMWVHPTDRWLYVGGANIIVGTGNVGDVIGLYAINQTTGDLPTLPGNYSGGNSNPPDETQGTGIAGDPNGKFLVDQFQFNGCGGLVLLTISPVDGGLSAQPNGPQWMAPTASLCQPASIGLAIDSTGSFLYANWGIFQVSSTTLVPPATPTLNTNIGFFLPDPIGAYLYQGSGAQVSGGITTNTINPTTGALTPVSTADAPDTFTFAISGSAPAAPAPGAAFQPASLTFTSLGVGTPTASQTLTFANTGTTTLDISNIAVTGTNAADFAQTNDCGSSLAGGANCTFTVIFTPTTTAAESAAITITGNASGSPHSAALSAPAYVAPPALPTLNPPLALSFPPTAVGSASTQSFSIVNSGGSTLSFPESHSAARIQGTSLSPVPARRSLRIRRAS